MNRWRIIAVLFCISCGIASFSHAQEEWKVDARMFLLAAGMEGEVGALGRTADVDLSFGDILSNLEFGFMGGAIAHNGVWSIGAEVSYMGLGMENDLVRADVNQWLIEGTLGHRLTRNLDAFGGLRVNALRDTFTFKGPLGFETEPHKSWVDPIVGVRFTPQFNEKWSLWSQFDIGGFGAGSDFTYQIHVLGRRRFNERMALDFGYRVLGVDYDSGDDAGRFVYDVTNSGPEFGLVYSF